MEKSKPMELGLGELLSNQNIVNNNSFRFINRDLGIVVSFAQMDSILFSTGKPYRTRESRIIRILKGEARISINLIEYKVKEPMIIISPCNSLIEIIEISEDYDFQVIVPDNNFLPISQGGALTDSYTKHGIFILPTEEELPQIDAFFSMIWDAVHKVPFRREVVQHLIMALLYNIRYIHAKNEESTPLQLSRQEEVFRRFIGLVNEHSKRERNISFYADKLCLTPHYLSTVIREVSGQTVMQWINQAVILEAKVLLKHSDLLVFQISDELGFPNPSFFSKFFKRITGMTPAEYQKKRHT